MRPAFVITATAGRGMGKSDLCKKWGELGNGNFDFSHGENIDRIKTRLLTEKASTKRGYLIDNIKTARLSWGELEGLITAPVICGHRLFKGERAKPDALTGGMLTMNGAAMSRDMAQRSVVVKLGKPTSPTWGRRNNHIHH